MATGVVVILVLSVTGTFAAFAPGCSFSNDQCVYNVKLGHAGQCDNPSAAVPSGSGTGSTACCDTVQQNVNHVQGLVEELTNELRQVQTELGLRKKDSDLLNSTANERDQLVQQLLQKEAELNSSQSNLALLIKQSAQAIGQLKVELAKSTSDLNNCKGVLGMKTNGNQVPVTASGDVNMTVCTFEDGMCGFVQDKGDRGDWSTGTGSVNRYTGPREDHTLGSPHGHYMYIDASKDVKNYGEENKTMRLISPMFPPAHAYCLRFWYNMYGSDTRGLRVYAKVGNGKGYPVFTSYGNLGQTWHLGEVSLDSEYTSHPFSLIFEGVTDSSRYSSSSSSIRHVYGDMALDDIYTYNTACNSIPRCAPSSLLRNSSTSSSCYTFHTSPLNWYNSSKACRTEGPNSHLVSVNSKEEQDFITNAVTTNAGLKAAGTYGWFTSGNDERSESHFDWTDTGTPYTSQYTDWHPGQPNNVASDQDCLLLQYADSNYEWGDIDCDEAHPYICEVEIPVV